MTIVYHILMFESLKVSKFMSFGVYEFMSFGVSGFMSFGVYGCGANIKTRN